MTRVIARGVFLALVLGNFLVCFSDADSCQRRYHHVAYESLTEKDRTKAGASNNNVEIHIRQNVKGQVNIVRQQSPNNDIIVKVNWSYPNTVNYKTTLKHNYTLVNSLVGTVYTLQLYQLDDIEQQSNLVKIIVSVSISALIIVLICLLLIWCKVRKKRRRARQRATEGTELHALCNPSTQSNKKDSGHRYEPQTELKYCAPTGALKTPVLIRTQKSNTPGKQVIPRIYNVQVSLSSPDGSTVSSPVLQRAEDGSQANTKEIDPRVLESVLRQRGGSKPSATSSPRRMRNDIELIKPEVLLVKSPLTTTTDSTETDKNRQPDEQANKTNALNHSNHSDSDHRSGSGSRTPVRPNTLVLATITVLSLFSLAYAACNTDVEVNVTIFIPTSNKLKITSIKMFTSVGGTLKEGSHWKNKVKIYDIESSKATTNKPCYPNFMCPEVVNTTMVGCDAATKTCACQRGYRLIGKYCEDIDECVEDRHTCSGPNVCYNTFGSHRCQCPEGHYASGDECKECSTCPKDTYEAVTCRAEMDTQCLHVADTLMRFESSPNKTVSDDVSNDITKWTSSSNVFVDDVLHADKHESSLMLTDNQQKGDVQWRRASGMVINVKLQDVSLVPEYRDVDHLSDNRYMEFELSRNKTKQKQFNDVLSQYCRHPMPQSYRVVLRFHRKRTSQLKTVKCGEDNPEGVTCPHWYTDGDEFQYRSLNEKCASAGSGSNLEILRQNVNKLFCLDKPDLLTKVFEKDVMDEMPISYAGLQCRKDVWDCNECLRKRGCMAEQQSCQRTFWECNKLQFDQHFRSMGEEANATCCGLACYAEDHCKRATQPECAYYPNSCAIGDVQQYEIVPVFGIDLTRKFRCHLKLKDPENLLKLRYNVILPPPLAWSSPTIYHTVPLDAGRNKNGGKTGKAKVDWLNLAYNRGINTPSEVIVVGSRDRSGKHELKAHKLKDFEDFYKGDYDVYLYSPISPPGHMTDVQFPTPFELSTANWRAGGCDKNVSRFFPTQDIFKKVPLEAEVKPASVVDRKPVALASGEFGYSMVATRTRPRLSINVAAKESLLKIFFKNSNKVLYYDTLNTQLVRDGKDWKLSISGNVSGCDAYVGFKIYDRKLSLLVGQFDTVVKCPSGRAAASVAKYGNPFKVTFQVPPVSMESEKSLEIVLEDPTNKHRLYASSAFLSMGSAKNALENSSLNDTMAAETLQALWTPVIQIAIVTAISLGLLLLGYMCVTCCRSKKTQKSEDLDDSTSKFEMDHATRLVQVVCYCIYKLLYNLMFTFTVTYLLVVIANKDTLSKIDTFNQFRSDKFLEREQFIGNISHHLNKSLHKQYSVFSHMIGSGVNYSKELSTSIERRMGVIQEDNLRKLNFSSVEVYTSKVCQAKLELYQAQRDIFIKQYRGDVKLQLDKLWYKYGIMLREVKATDWLGMLNQLFKQLPSDNKKRNAEVTEQDMEMLISYLSFLGVDRARSVQTSAILLDSLVDEVPGIPTLFECEGDCITQLGVQHLLPVIQPVNDLSSQTVVYVDTNLTFSYLELEPPRETSEKKDGESVSDSDAFASFMSSLWYSLPIVFVSLDAVLLLYRFTAMGAMVRQFKMGFDIKVAPDTLDEGNNGKLQKELDIIKKQIIEDSDTDRLSSFYGTYRPSDNNISQRQLLDTSQAQGRTTVVFGQHKEDSESISSKIVHFVYRRVCSGVVPKLCFIVFVLLMLTAVLDGIGDSVSADVLRSVAVSLNIIPQSQTSYVTFANMLLQDHASQLNAALDGFKHHVDTQIYHLGALVDVFNFEQQQILNIYNNQLCSLQQTLNGTSVCQSDTAIQKLDVDILRTNFWPITPKTFSSTTFEADLEDIFRFTSALKQFIFNTSYVIIGIIIFMVLFDLIGQLIFLVAKLTNQVKVNRIYHLSYCVMKDGQDGVSRSSALSPPKANSSTARSPRSARNQNESDV